jgi:hypothetical protein
MKDLKYQIEHLEPLNLKEQGELHGGFVSINVRKKPNSPQHVNYFQCGCDNYCPKHRC